MIGKESEVKGIGGQAAEPNAGVVSEGLGSRKLWAADGEGAMISSGAATSCPVQCPCLVGTQTSEPP